MDKDKLIQTIQSAKVSEVLKKELLDLVENEESFGPETVKKVQAKLDQRADETIDKIADLRTESAVAKFNQDMDGLEKGIGDFQEEVNKKADDIDKKAVRKELV